MSKNVKSHNLSSIFLYFFFIHIKNYDILHLCVKIRRMIMTKKWSLEKALWYCVVCFLTFIFIGSFITSGNFKDLLYVLIVYLFLLVGHFIK